MSKPKAKSAVKHAAPRKRLTSERALKLRPSDSEEPKEAAEGEKAKKPRQARLPEMQDPEIEELESAAESYAGIRDRRQVLTTEEVRLKTELLGLMHREKRTEYNHGGVSIKVLVEKEKVRVRIKKEKDED